MVVASLVVFWIGGVVVVVFLADLYCSFGCVMLLMGAVIWLVTFGVALVGLVLLILLLRWN